MSDIVTDTEEFSLGPGAKLTSGTKPKLHAVSPAIAANARIMAALYDSGDLDHGAAKDSRHGLHCEDR